MRVKMLTRAAGPNYSYEPGQVVAVADETARAWIAARHAVEMEQPTKPEAKPEPVPEAKREAATIEPTEAAVESPPRRRRRTTE